MTEPNGDRNDIWQEDDMLYPTNGIHPVPGPANSSLYMGQEHYGMSMPHQGPNAGDNFTVFYSNGNYLKVYHNNDESMNFNNYKLFSNNNFIPQHNMHKTQQQPMHDNFFPGNQHERSPDDNTNNMFINQLVENWVPNISGTYSPFGEPPQSMQMRENLLGFNMPINQSDSYSFQTTANDFTQRTQIEEPIRPPSVSNNTAGTNGSFQHESTIKKTEIKKPRIVAEVKPMRMTYSDVLSKNVFISKNDSISTNGNNTNGGISVQSQTKSSKILSDKNKSNTFSSNYEKKSNNIIDDKETFINKKTTNSVTQKSDEQTQNNVFNQTKEAKGFFNADDEYKENKSQENDSKSSKKRKGKNIKLKSSQNSNGYDANKKRPYSQTFQSDFEPKIDDNKDMKNNGFFYNITKNESQLDKSGKQYQHIVKKGTKIPTTSGRSTVKTEKPNSYQKRNQRIRQHNKYAMLVKLMEKWLEYMVKFLTWLASLVYDVVVLSWGMLCERFHTGYEYACQIFDTMRKEFKNNSGLPTAYCKKLWFKFDRKFSKESKWAFWRHMFSKKRAPEPPPEHFRNGRLPSTGDEAMYSLLNCKGKDAYSILGVSSDCSQEQIRKHYKKIAVLVHPDKNKQAGAEEAFKILQRAFELIGEPENRQSYDQSVAEALNAEKAWSELNDLLSQLQSKIAEAANTIRCSSCGLRHPRRPTGRPHFAARECNSCKIRHTAREGDIWAETTVFGFRWKYLALMEGKVYDITEWANCQKGALSHLQPNSHIVQYRIVLGGQQQQQQQQQQEKDRVKHSANEPTLDEFLDNLYSGQNPQTQSRRRKRKN